MVSTCISCLNTARCSLRSHAAAPCPSNRSVTDQQALDAVIQATGAARTLVEQFLSKGPSVPVIRRHAKSEQEMHFAPAIRVVSGNYVAAKRRGVIDGTDFGFTGEVRFVTQVRAASDVAVVLCCGRMVLPVL